MHTLFNSILLILFAQLCQAGDTGSIRGQLVDSQSGAVIVGANVIVLRSIPPRGAASDTYGSFHIPQVPVGTYDLEVSCLSYHTMTLAEVVVAHEQCLDLGKIELNPDTSSVITEIFVARREKISINLAGQLIGDVVDEHDLLACESKFQQVLAIPGFKMDNEGKVHARGGRDTETEFVFNGSGENGELPRGQILPSTDRVVHNLESYAAYSANAFARSIEQPFSTFSVDVDAASYTNVRRIVASNHLPSPGSVRIEEFVNAFRYDYDEPLGEHPLKASMDLAVCPWNPSNALLRIGVQGRMCDKEDLAPSNLVFLIDVSGSMGQRNKLPLLKESFRILVDQLRDEDLVSIVTYASGARLVLPPTSGGQKEQIVESLNQLRAGGSTAGSAGIQQAYAQAEAAFIKGGNNRVILATDGDFNVGVSSNDALMTLISEKRDTGVFLSVLGFGDGNYKDDKMQVLAQNGNGHHSYIDGIREARRVFRHELLGTLFVIAKDVKLQVEFNPARVEGYRLIGYENRLLDKQDFVDDVKDAGELGVGHQVTALYELMPAKHNDTACMTGRYQETMLLEGHDKEWLTLRVRYKQPDGRSSVEFEEILVGEILPVDDMDDDFRFACSVAGFGMLLRGSEFVGTATYAMVHDLAVHALGNDPRAERAGFLSMVAMAREISN